MMKRKLFKQIKNDWRENVWFIVELMVVFPVIWYLVAMLYLQTKDTFLPRGFEPDNVYVGDPRYVSDKSPKYVESEENGYLTDLEEIVRSLSKNPNVESVAITDSYPYNYNFMGNNLMLLDEVDSVSYYGNTRTATPEYIDVLKIKSRTGKTREQLKAMLGRGEVLISDNNFYNELGRDPMNLIGKRMYYGSDSSYVYRIGDVIEKIRRNDYENTPGGTILMPIAEENRAWADIILRVKDGRGAYLLDDFTNNPELNSHRNVYLTSLQSMDDIRESCQRSIVLSIRSRVMIMVFLLVTIFLGLLGSFWFRMQQRTGEIAIRKICGARRRDIFARVISEGMILLLIAAVPATACVLPFASDYLTMPVVAYICTGLVALTIVALGIILSLWYPARRAMNIEPAEAIKTE